MIPHFFTPKNVADWRVDGAIVLPAFFSQAEMQPIIEEFDRLSEDARPKVGSAFQRDSGDSKELPSQFSTVRSLPIAEAPQTNFFALHPAIIELAKAALGTPDVRLYLYHTWAKFTGHTDFDQVFHMDYHNNTLTVPGEAPEFRSVNFIIYASDVTDAHGATRYVPRPQGDEICGSLRPSMPTPDQQEVLRRVEQSAAGPLGTAFMYTTDVYHRGSNLTAQNGHRYTIHVGYRAAGCDAFNFFAWPSQAIPNDGKRRNPWEDIFARATPEQLACLSVPLPGHPFWTEMILARVQNRWPMLNLDPWRDALLRHS